MLQSQGQHLPLNLRIMDQSSHNQNITCNFILLPMILTHIIRSTDTTITENLSKLLNSRLLSRFKRSSSLSMCQNCSQMCTFKYKYRIKHRKLLIRVDQLLNGKKLLYLTQNSQMKIKKLRLYLQPIRKVSFGVKKRQGRQFCNLKSYLLIK